MTNDHHLQSDLYEMLDEVLDAAHLENDAFKRAMLALSF